MKSIYCNKPAFWSKRNHQHWWWWWQ